MKKEDVKIIITGETICDYPRLHELDGIGSEDDFADYFDSNFTFKDSITSGYMSFKYDKNTKKLYVVVEYDSERLLSDEELYVLKDYTEGQLSDGIGEGFEQLPCLEDVEEYLDSYGEITTDVYISPWFFGQILTIKQELI
jgi:hypothetical protein